MVYTCNDEELWKVHKRWEKVNVLSIIDRNHQRSMVAVDHFRNLVELVDDGYNIENRGIAIFTYREKEKEIYCSKLKKLES